MNVSFLIYIYIYIYIYNVINDKCLIYLLTCKVCGKQDTGKTVDKFRSRWNNYKDSHRAFLRGEEIKQKFLHEHFLKDDHHGFEKDVSICLIDKTVF